MKRGEAPRVRSGRRLPVRDGRVGEEEPQHRPGVRALNRHARVASRLGETRDEPQAGISGPVPDPGLREHAERLDPGGHGERVPGERAGLIDGT